MADSRVHFLGRRRERADLSGLVRRNRLVTLTGVGGVGKTQLALQVAARVDASFRDGVWLIELADLEDGNVLDATVAATLGLREAALGLQQAPSGPTHMLAEYLADKRLLLVLDGCEHVRNACAALVHTLLKVAPGLCVLTTSRQPLGLLGETIRVVAPLSVPSADQQVPVEQLPRYEAVQLFIARAAVALPGFVLTADNCLTVLRICQRLEGIPLAIELAAARLRTVPLERILDPLEPTGADDTTATQPLRATLDATLAQCTPAQRLLWARLSVFSDGVDLEAAEEVCSGNGIDPNEVLDLVAELIDKSILTLQESGSHARYRMRKVIADYGRNLLTQAGERASLRQRHRDYYLHLTKRVEADWMSPRQLEWLTRLRCEHDNLRAALEFCFSGPGSAQAALGLAAGLGRYWLVRSGLTEGRYWLDRALQLEAEPSTATASALWVNGWLAILQGDTSDGLRLLQRSRALAQQLGGDMALRRVVQFSGLAALFQGEFATALPLFEQALTRHREANDLEGIWLALYQLAITTAHLGDTDRALAYGQECLDLCEAREAYWSNSYALWVTGTIRWRQGDAERAAPLIRESLRLRHSFHDVWGTVLCLEVLAWIATAEGHHEHAATLLGGTHKLWRSIGSAPTTVSYLAAAHEQCETTTRTALGEGTYTHLLHHGARLTTEQTVNAALGQTHKRRPHTAKNA